MRKRKPAAGQVALFFDELEPAVELVTREEQEAFAERVGAPINRADPAVLEAANVPPRIAEAGEIVPVADAGPLDKILGGADDGGFWAMPPELRALREAQARNREAGRAQFAGFPLKKIRDDLEPEWEGGPRLFHGWLLPHLFDLHVCYVGRWDYWLALATEGRLTREQGPIPTLPFNDFGDAQVWKMLEQCLDAIPRSGSWRGWSGSSNFDYFLDWLLFGLGHTKQAELPPEPFGGEGAALRLYQAFQLGPLLLWPFDYLGELMAQSGWGKAAGFYPTPHNVVNMMTAMIMGDGDRRAETVCDPCVGTGRMLLHAGAYSLRLYGIDIMPQAVKATTVNAALFVPWLYRPLEFLFGDGRRSEEGGTSLEHGNALASA